MAIDFQPRAKDSSADAALSPDFTVMLARELTGLLSQLSGTALGVSVSGTRGLARLFGTEVADARLDFREAQKNEGISVGNFRAWPVFLTEGWRSVEAAFFNKGGLERALAEFFPNSRSSIRGGIGEAVRNIGQHGHRQRGVFMAYSEEARFAPGGVFVQAFKFPTSDGRTVPLLLAVVADEGDGIGSPSIALVDGEGDSTRGGQHEGLGVELSSALLYVIKARDGDWQLYDRSVCTSTSRGGRVVIDPVCSLKLPPVDCGCQKIMFFVPPLAETPGLDPHFVQQRKLDEEVVRHEILRALEALKV
jgi:anti-sigma regulatory factor (Ser/Thr protein kinase)